MAMANLPLPPCSKYCHITAETMVMENSLGSNRKEVFIYSVYYIFNICVEVEMLLSADCSRRQLELMGESRHPLTTR